MSFNLFERQVEHGPICCFTPHIPTFIVRLQNGHCFFTGSHPKSRKRSGFHYQTYIYISQKPYRLQNPVVRPGPCAPLDTDHSQRMGVLASTWSIHDFIRWLEASHLPCAQCQKAAKLNIPVACRWSGRVLGCRGEGRRVSLKDLWHRRQ